MKYIVRFSKMSVEGNVTLDRFNPDFDILEMSEITKQYLPLTRIFKHITVKNFLTIPADLLSSLTFQYLHGAEIEFSTPDRKFNKVYQIHASDCRPAYAYKYTPLDLTKPMPKSLAEFTFEYQGKQTTYLDAIKTLKSVNYLPNEIWEALDIYSQQQINKCQEYNKGRYICAEDWFKQLMHDAMDHSIKVFSPNKKTYLEVIAERTFEKDCANAHLQEGLRPLNEKELAFLVKYAPIYGVEIPTFQWKINTRKTEHGYTQEPEQVFGGMSHSDWNRLIYNKYSNSNIPRSIRQGLMINECANDKYLRQAYFQLRWLMKHLKDEALMPGWKRCPVCHKLYRENEGCECGHCEPVTYLPADNLFYGITSTFEDYEATQDQYAELDTDLDYIFEEIEELADS